MICIKNSCPKLQKQPNPKEQQTRTHKTTTQGHYNIFKNNGLWGKSFQLPNGSHCASWIESFQVMFILLQWNRLCNMTERYYALLMPSQLNGFQRFSISNFPSSLTYPLLVFPIASGPHLSVRKAESSLNIRTHLFYCTLLCTFPTTSALPGWLQWFLGGGIHQSAAAYFGTQTNVLQATDECVWIKGCCLKKN